MSYLQVRDFPEELHEQLRLLAQHEHRSVSQQTIIAIREHVAQAAARAQCVQHADATNTQGSGRGEDFLTKRKQVLARIAEKPRVDISERIPSITEIIQEERAKRDDRIRL